MNIFITGYNRSGTSLLQSLLLNHPAIHISAQPFFNLFALAKKDFFTEKLKIQAPPFPLVNFFDKPTYGYRTSTDFFQEYSPAYKKFIEAVGNNKGYSGQYQDVEATKIPGTLNGKRLIEKFKWLWGYYSRQNDSETRVAGSKEIICEEFLPFLVQNKVHTILVIRDPRDILTSMNFGKGADFVGNIKPTLFNIRNWRKSVAFAIELVDSDYFTCVLYEDLINHPEREVNKILGKINCTAVDKSFFSKQLKDESGKIWAGNSSFDNMKNISSKSVGRYKSKLDKDQIRFIERFCLPELLYLGYSVDRFSLEGFEVRGPNLMDPFKWDKYDTRFNIYKDHPKRIAEEYDRIEILHNPGKYFSSDYFLSTKVYKTLLEKITTSR